MLTPPHFRKALLASALCAGLAACSSGSSPSAPPKASTAPATSAPATTPASSPSAAAITTPTQKAIATNWTAFFNPKEPAAMKGGLLQDAQQFAATLKALGAAPTAAQSSAKVTAVTVLSSSQAKVTYDILLGGKPVLPNQSGTAVLQGGTWKVGAASFCALVALQSGGSTKSLPAICKQG
jgi:hypothetical protein